VYPHIFAAGGDEKHLVPVPVVVLKFAGVVILY